MRSRVVVALAFASLLSGSLLWTPSARAETLWTEPQKSKAAVNLPSVAPLVERFEPAVLVIFTEGDFAATDMPAGHGGGGGALPPGHPPIGGGGGGGAAPPGHGTLPPGHPPIGGMGGMGGDDDDQGDGPDMQGQGAGFLITPNGYAITNHHVVEGARKITVMVGESHEEIDATVIGTDEKTDIALIKLDSPRTDWPVIPLGDSDALKVGDFVVAIGSPFGLAQSVSLGILSARGRKDIAPSGRTGLYDFLQTDASINPGNSGGPLLNLNGDVIGINAAVNASGSGIGFAIPINMVKRLLPQLKEKGRVARSWIGVGIQPVMPEAAHGFGLERARGALVREVVDGGPAAKAGLEPGDVILSFEGKLIEDANDLPLLAGDAGAGKKVALEVLRDKAKKTVGVVLGEHPDNTPAPEKTLDKTPEKAPPKDLSVGVTVVTLDNAARERLSLKGTSGTRIVKVKMGSAAFMGGLMTDDVVIKVNGKATADAKEFAAALKATPSGELLKMIVRRAGSTLFVAVVKP